MTFAYGLPAAVRTVTSDGHWMLGGRISVKEMKDA